MLKLSEFRHNHHPSEVRMLAKFIRRGFSVILFQGGEAIPRSIPAHLPAADCKAVRISSHVIKTEHSLVTTHKS
jgi:hypothetical protein